MKLKLAIILSLLSVSAYANDPSQYGTQTAPLPSSCTKGVDCYVNSTHFAAVINKTNVTKTVLVIYQVCPEGEICQRAQYKIVIPAGGQWHDTKKMTKVAKYYFPGDRTFTASTMLVDAFTNRNLSETWTKGITHVYG